MMQKKTLF